MLFQFSVFFSFNEEFISVDELIHQHIEYLQVTRFVIRFLTPEVFCQLTNYDMMSNLRLKPFNNGHVSKVMSYTNVRYYSQTIGYASF